MSLLANLGNTKVESQAASVGFTRTPSGVYPAQIKLLFLDANEKGTVSLNGEVEIIPDVTKPTERRSIFVREYISFAGGEFEKVENGKPKQMFGLKRMEALLKVATGSGLAGQEIEKKLVEVFEGGQKKMAEREVLVSATRAQFKAGVLHTIEDKTAKNNQTGKYEPTGETYETNTLDQFFNADSDKHITEIEGDKPAKFIKVWTDKFVTGEPVNRAKGKAASGAQSGAPNVGGNEANSSGSLFPS